MWWWGLIKALSLGYLLSLVSLSAVSGLLLVLRPRLAPRLRADFSFLVLSSTSLIHTVLTTAIWLGVSTGQIRMTTTHFHRLMNGGTGALIAITGIIALLASLLLLLRGWLKSRVPPEAGASSPPTIHGLPLRASARVSTASLVGVWRPQIWINPGYLSTLSNRELSHVVYHERVHLKRRDNLRKLVLQFIAGLFTVLPFARRWVSWYEIDSELAVDDYCRRKLPAEEYRTIVAKAVDYARQSRCAPVLSALSQVDIAERLRALATPRGVSRPLAVVLLGWLICIVGALPAFALLLHAIPRCLLACYLGY